MEPYLQQARPSANDVECRYTAVCDNLRHWNMDLLRNVTSKSSANSAGTFSGVRSQASGPGDGNVIAYLRGHKMLRSGATFTIFNNSTAENHASLSSYTIDHIAQRDAHATLRHAWSARPSQSHIQHSSNQPMTSTTASTNAIAPRQSAVSAIAHAMKGVPNVVGFVRASDGRRYIVRPHSVRKDVFDVIVVNRTQGRSGNTREVGKSWTDDLLAHAHRVGVIRLSNVSMWKHSFSIKFLNDVPAIVIPLTLLIVKSALEHGSDDAVALTLSQTIATLPFVGAAAT